jgi:hypothetical protein
MRMTRTTNHDLLLIGHACKVEMGDFAKKITLLGICNPATEDDIEEFDAMLDAKELAADKSERV